MSVLLVASIALALVFVFTVGFHDASGAIATSVSTRALTPVAAVLMAAGLNLVGALVGERLARSVATGLVSPDVGAGGQLAIVVALSTAIVWNCLTWWWGMPSSTSHALIAAMVGAALPWMVPVSWSTVAFSVLLPLLLVPVVAFTVAYLWTRTMIRFVEWTAWSRVNAKFKAAQAVSAATYALGHGLQAGQKTMGVILFILIGAGLAGHDTAMPVWARISVALALGLGTLVGGWRIVRTVGRRLADLDPLHGFSAESAATLMLVLSTYPLALPISTTHTIASAVAGAASTNGLRSVRAKVAGKVVGVWAATFPVVLLVAYVLSWLVSQVVRPG